MLPHDKEAEQGVLGAIIHANDALLEARELLRPEHFFSAAHRELFQAMLDLADRSEPIDEITLGYHLRAKNQLEKVGGLAYIAELVDLTPVASNVMVYAQIVLEKHRLRTLIDTAMEIASKGRESPEDVEGLIQRAENVFQELATQATRQRFSLLKDLLYEQFGKLEASQETIDGLSGLPTGFKELDRVTNGLQPSDLIIVAARPSMGKTSFVMNIAQHVALRRKVPVAVFSLEMSKQQLALRLLCAQARVDSHKLRVGNLDEFDWDKLAQAAGELSEASVFIDETAEITPPALKAVCRRIQAEHGLGMIVVDYLQLMRAGRRTDNREQEIAEISRGLKAVAKELDVPVLVCAQLNRALESRADKRPLLSDLRESGSIEQDADLVMVIYRDEVYNADTEDAGIAEVHIRKHRNGPITTRPIRLAFISMFTKFAALELQSDQGERYN
ncbi:MAG: replicative DNA helicase [Candidatus Lambdaproteobacteria bacterium]|nr:replicative DNA helicase [Candidatus Lambdaproteobacteria bacterium]